MKGLFSSVYEGKTVLVTGHTGFKGSWLSIWLKELGANVIGYSLDPLTDKDNFVVTELKNKIIDIRGDIRDEKKLEAIIEKYKPEIIFHLAAQPLVSLSYKIPKDTYEINVMGTLNVLECIRKFDFVKIGVMITTDKCYENKEQIWPYREMDPMGGYDPYSSSKGCTEILISSYRNSFININDYKKHGKVIASVRAGNVIGGGDWAEDRIVPDCIKSIINNDAIEIRNPNAVRPWQHVLEPLSGYLLLGSKMYEEGIKYSGAWNFGPKDEGAIQVYKIVDTIIKKWGSGKWMDLSNPNNLHEAKLLRLDCSKANTYLNWKAKLDIEQVLEYTVNWYKNYEKIDPYEICKQQIFSYYNL